MAKWVIDNGTLVDIADAVRAKRGTEEPIRVNNLASEIRQIDGSSALDKFFQNAVLDYEYDASTNANYTVLRIYKKRIDGSIQIPFVRYPTRMTALELAELEDNWFLIINSGLGVNASTPVDGVIIENGFIVNNSPASYHAGSLPLTIDENGDLGYAQADVTGQELVDNGIVSATCGFCPIIIDYEAVQSFPSVDHVSHFNQNAQRQIIGQFGNGDYAIVTCEGRNFDHSDGWTLPEAQTICRKLGLKFAYNLDGGGSVQTVIGKKQINSFYENGGTEARTIPTFIVFNGTSTFGKQPVTRTLSSLRIYTNKDEYTIGEQLGDVITCAKYSDKTETPVQANVTSDVNMDVVGTYHIWANYTEGGILESATKTISVVEAQAKVLSSITATKTTTIYSVNDTLDTQDIVVTAHYTDNTTADVTSSATIDATSVDTSIIGTYSISVSYTEDGVTKTDNISIIVDNVVLPTGYTKIGSVKFTGEQYTLPQVKESEVSRCVYDVEVEQESANGSHILSSVNLFMPFPKSSNISEHTQNQFYGKIFGTDVTIPYNFTLNTRYLIDCDTVAGTLDVNGSRIGTFMAGSTVSGTQKPALGTYGAGDATKYRFHGKIYSMKIYNANGDLISNLVPCVEQSTGIVGFYDLVKSLFRKSITETPFVNGDMA